MVDITKYLEERVEPQITWYEKRANSNKKKFHACQIVIIITSAIIPIINIIDFVTLAVRITSSILGGIILGLTGLIQLKKFQDNWILFRTNEEMLKKEKFLYLNQAGGYANISNKDERDKLFVERVESIISSETSRFFTMHSQKPSTSTESSDKSKF